MLAGDAAGWVQSVHDALHAAKVCAYAQGMSLLRVELDMDFVVGLTERVVVVQFGEKVADGAAAAAGGYSAVIASPTRISPPTRMSAFRPPR